MLSVLMLTAIIILEAGDIPLFLEVGASARVLAASVYYSLFPQVGLPCYGEVAAIALTFLGLTYLLVYCQARATRQQARSATVTGKVFRPRCERRLTTHLRQGSAARKSLRNSVPPRRETTKWIPSRCSSVRRHMASRRKTPGSRSLPC
jgi:ABC-type Fe3+ transport system permease subunit